MTKRIISLLLALIICFSVMIFPGSAVSNNTDNLSIAEQLKQNGIPVISSKVFLKIFKCIFFPNIDATIDETLNGLTDYIAEQSGLDVGLLIENFPDVQNFSRLLYKSLPIDSENVRKTFYNYADQLSSDNKTLEAYIVHFLGAFFSVIDKMEFSAIERPDQGNNIIEVVLTMTFLDGSTEDVHSGLFINLDTGLAYSENDKGMIGTGFEFDIYKLVGYATVHCWQREFGFCLGYDFLCFVLPIFNYRTRRFKFEYDNSEWMIQIWKGNYVVANGSEVGIYKRDKGSLGSYYNCIGDEDLLNMSMNLSHYGTTLISVEEQPHWWVNGFNFGKRLYLPSTLDLSFSIEMKDQEMLEAFTKSIEKEYHHDVNYTVDGLTVYCNW